MSLNDITERIASIKPDSFSRGGFAILCKAEFHSSDGSQHYTVAIKLPDLQPIGDREGLVPREKMLERWWREIKAGPSVSHPNILPFLGVYVHPEPEYEGSKGIVLPYYANGDARVFIKDHPEADRLRILCGVAAAICALHSSKPPVVHGDIKGANVLIDDNGVPCLADFGLSRICDTRGFTTESVNGTCRWMAAELLKASASAEDRPMPITPASDVWALAMTILELLTGSHPFAELKKDGAVFLGIVVGHALPAKPCDPCITNAIWTLLECCWKDDPNARPDACHVGLVLDVIYGGSYDIDSSTVLAILEGTLDDSEVHQDTTTSNDETLPYMCKWPHCPRRFKTLDSCIEHECAEFEKRSAKNDLH